MTSFHHALRSWLIDSDFHLQRLKFNTCYLPSTVRGITFGKDRFKLMACDE